MTRALHATPLTFLSPSHPTPSHYRPRYKRGSDAASNTTHVTASKTKHVTPPDNASYPRARTIRDRVARFPPCLMSLVVFLSALLLVLPGPSTARRAAPVVPGYDVCVVGAGGSGAYAAMRLKQLGRTVLVLEQQDRVGGHCETTYTSSGDFVDTGVELYYNVSVVRKAFSDFNVSLRPYDITHNPARVLAPQISVSGTGQYLGFIVPPNATQYPEFFQAVEASAEATAKWVSMFQQRFPFIDTPHGENTDFSALNGSTVEKLLQPFGPLLHELELEYGGPGAFAPLYQLFDILSLNGFGPYREVSAYTALRNFRPSAVTFFQGNGYTAANGCSSIYSAFAAYLGPALQLGVTKLQVKRSSSSGGGASVSFKDAGGAARRGSCSKLVVAAEQRLDNLRSFMKDLDDDELAVFGQVTSNTLTQTLVTLPASDVPGALPYLDIWVTNETSANLPGFTGMYKFPFGYGATWSLYPVPPNTLSTKAARKFDFENVKRVAKASRMFDAPRSVKALDTDLHTYFQRPRRVQDTPAFFAALYALQGHRSTYYTGALLSFNLQSDVWRYSEHLVTDIMKF